MERKCCSGKGCNSKVSWGYSGVHSRCWWLRRSTSCKYVVVYLSMMSFLCLRRVGLTGEGIMFSHCPFVRPSVCPSVCYRNCEDDILKTNGPILMPNSASIPRDNVMQWSTLGIRGSKITQGQWRSQKSHTAVSCLKNCRTNFNQTWRAHTMLEMLQQLGCKKSKVKAAGGQR